MVMVKPLIGLAGGLGLANQNGFPAGGALKQDPTLKGKGFFSGVTDQDES